MSPALDTPRARHYAPHHIKLTQSSAAERVRGGAGGVGVRGPAGDVSWTILYQRYSLWRARGVWDEILRIVHPDADTPFIA